MNPSNPNLREYPRIIPLGSEPPDCQQCGHIMVFRTAKRGAFQGTKFWGCSMFAKGNCRGTRESEQVHEWDNYTGNDPNVLEYRRVVFERDQRMRALENERRRQKRALERMKILSDTVVGKFNLELEESLQAMAKELVA